MIVYPHKPQRNIEVTTCNTRLSAHLMYGLMSIWWFASLEKKYDHTWRPMSLLRPGVIEQHKPYSYIIWLTSRQDVQVLQGVLVIWPIKLKQYFSIVTQICPSCLAHLNSIDCVTWKTWTAIKKSSPITSLYPIVNTKRIIYLFHTQTSRANWMVVEMKFVWTLPDTYMWRSLYGESA